MLFSHITLATCVQEVQAEKLAKRQRQAEAKAELGQVLEQESDSDAGEP